MQYGVYRSLSLEIDSADLGVFTSVKPALLRRVGAGLM